MKSLVLKPDGCIKRLYMHSCLTDMNAHIGRLRKPYKHIFQLINLITWMANTSPNLFV